MTQSDYYSILDVKRNASIAEIKSAYKKLAKQYHPDVNKSADSHEKFKEISRAYQVLSDTDKRSAYDRMGHSAFEQARQSGFSGKQEFYQGNINFDDLFSGGFRDPFDIFEEFFGGGFHRSRSRTEARGEDLEMVVSLEFDEAVHGVQKEIQYQAYDVCPKCDGSGSAAKSGATTCSQCQGQGRVRHQQSFLGASFAQIVVCPTCQGSGEVIKDPCRVCQGTGRDVRSRNLTIRVPAGVDDGTRMRYPGQGNAGKRQQSAGDLYLIFKVKPHPEFKRQGFDIYVEKSLTPAQAALGTKIAISTIHGAKTLKIPAGTQPGKQFKISGQGVPRINSNQRGDQFVIVNVQIPNKLNLKQKQLYQKLLELEQKPDSILNKIFS